VAILDYQKSGTKHDNGRKLNHKTVEQSRVHEVSPVGGLSIYGGKDLWKRCVLSPERKEKE